MILKRPHEHPNSNDGDALHRRSTRVYLDGRIWLIYAALFSISIPWYWDPNSDRTLWGLPLWVGVTLVSSFLISLFTAWLLVFRWPGEERPQAHRDE